MGGTIRAVLRQHAVIAVLLGAVLLACAYAASLRPWTPIFDEMEYLAYARSLALAGTYAATPEGPEHDTRPGREPLYPVLVAAAIRLDPRLGEIVTDCWPYKPACGRNIGDLRYLNAILIAIAAWALWLTTRTLGAGAIAGWVAAGYILFNLQMNKTATHVISDYLALALVALSCLALVKAATGRPRWWLAASAAVSALVLTKAIYGLFAAALLAGLALHGLVRLSRAGMRALLPLVLAATVLVATVGAWTARNLALFGAAHDNRSALALSTREIFNHMTWAENAAAFVWWTRGFGETLARRVLPESAWRRHDLYAEGGFYMQGQVHRYEARVRRHMEAYGVPRAAAEAAMAGTIVREMLATWPGYLASMPALFYRGLWFDEFIVFGLPALLWLLVRGWRTRDGPTLLALAPGVFSLLAYAALSLNLPRYQFTAAPALAIAAGFAAQALTGRWQSWRMRRRMVSPVGIEPTTP